MIDAVAAVVMLVGTTLSLLGAIGLLRFPDVFARMHAATKPATLGLILVVAAAALESGEPGAAFLLLAVIAFVFLTAPLATGMLAQAAYHTGTELSPTTVRDDLAGATLGAVTASGRLLPGRRAFLVVWLTLTWVLLWGEASAGNLVGGLLVAGLVVRWLPALPQGDDRGRLRPWAAMRYAAFFAREVVLANLQVARAVLSPRPVQVAVVRVPTRVRTDAVVALLMNSLTFTPGTLTIEVDPDTRDLFVHVLDLDDPERFAAQAAEMERLATLAFGAADEAAAAAAARPGD